MRLALPLPPASLRSLLAVFLVSAVFPTAFCAAQKKSAAKPQTDVLVLSDGDTLHGTLVSTTGDQVKFHTESLGDVSVAWKDIGELRTTGRYAVLTSNANLRSKLTQGSVPAGTLVMENQAITVHPSGEPALPPVPVKKAQYIIGVKTLSEQATRRSGVFSGWNGAITAGATLVTATQNQYTFSGGVSLARIEPSVTWLERRNRSTVGFNGSYGKITQPSYVDSTGALVPSVVTKTAIYHAAAEHDEYFSPQFFALGQVGFDHNFSQDLDLQQIYGAGIGWTAIKTPRQEADLKGTAQYEKQLFIQGSASGNQNLIGSTFAVDYTLQTKLFTYAQTLSYIPAFNNPHAYSANETNTFAFPAYKSLSFSLGTLDSYLNNPPVSLPPTRRNSFQFTMGLTYAIKSKY